MNYKDLIHCSLYEWRETREPGGNDQEHMENMQNLDGFWMSTLTRFGASSIHKMLSFKGLKTVG